MRDLKRIIRILSLIHKIWIRYPDLRLTQLIGNCFEPGDLYNKEDKLLGIELKKRYPEVFK